MSWTMNYLKREFYYRQSKINIENDDSICHAIYVYVCKVCCLKKPFNKPLIILLTRDGLVIMGKYQTSGF